MFTHLKAFLWSLFGLFFVFIVVIEMNENGMLPNQDKEKSSMSFEVQKIVKAKPKPKPKPKPERKQTAKKSTATPNLTSSLSGIDTGLDAFNSADENMDDSLLGDSDKDIVMSEGSVDKAPQPSQRSAMEYPKKAKKMGVKGYVLLNLLIDANGHVEKVKVLESEPAGVFDDVAVEGIKSWVFTPGEYKGKAVKVWAKQKIRFDFQ
jgi:protein TonB